MITKKEFNTVSKVFWVVQVGSKIINGFKIHWRNITTTSNLKLDFKSTKKFVIPFFSTKIYCITWSLPFPSQFNWLHFKYFCSTNSRKTCICLLSSNAQGNCPSYQVPAMLAIMLTHYRGQNSVLPSNIIELCMRCYWWQNEQLNFPSVYQQLQKT